MKIKNKQTGEIYTVWKYVLSIDGIESVWCNDWYGHHRIGFDCEWATEESEALPTMQERIKADAEAYANGIGDFYRKMGALYGYIAGATAVHAQNESVRLQLEAQNSNVEILLRQKKELIDRSQVLVDALEAIKRTLNWIENADELDIIRKALEQWKGGKVEPPKPVASNCGMCGKLGNNQYLGNQLYLCNECLEDYNTGKETPEC